MLINSNRDLLLIVILLISVFNTYLDETDIFIYWFILIAFFITVVFCSINIIAKIIMLIKKE